MIKKKHFRVKHQKVKLFRANEPILSVFMWGINHTINELSHVNIPVMLLPDDFRAYSKIKVDNHLFNKENMPSHFKVKEYCPLVFRNLRERFGVDDVDYRESLTRSQPVQIDSSGKSGAQFYRSYDKFFILKSLTSEEIERMHAFLKHYHPYVVERHGNTLLPQYLGMYRLTVDGVQYYFVVMRNVFSSHLNIHRKFDLKGSTVDREASDKELEKSLPTLKDNDFIKQKIRFYIGDIAKTKFMEMMNADVNFLARLHLMDYSLLVGIHDKVRAEEEAIQQEIAARDGAGRETSESEECDSGERWTYNTPPDSPRCPGQHNDISQELDIYAIQSLEDIKRKILKAIRECEKEDEQSADEKMIESSGEDTSDKEEMEASSGEEKSNELIVDSVCLKRIKLKTNEEILAKDLSHFVTPETVKFLSFGLPTGFMSTEPETWIQREDYDKAIDIVRNLHVVNDAAERGVKLIEDYNKVLCRNEDEKLFFSRSSAKIAKKRREIYFIAIIDVLTQYGVKKQAAKAAKTVKYGSNVDGISTCDPEQYAKRFIEFIDKAIE